jgi:hypothetical protein
LIWQATQIAELARTLIANERIENVLTHRQHEETCRAQPIKHDGVLAQLKAKPLRGGPKGRP